MAASKGFLSSVTLRKPGERGRLQAISSSKVVRTIPVTTRPKAQGASIYPVYPFFDVKWILPPRSSGHYAASKAFAEGAGYETVEHDDFSYPPR